MPLRSTEDRLAVMEILLEMVIQEVIPDTEAQAELMDRLIDRTTGMNGMDEVAHDWDDRVMRQSSMRNRLARKGNSDGDLEV